MIEEHDVREMLRRRASAVPTTELDAPKAARRGRRRLLANGAVAVLATAAIAGATFAGIQAVRTAPVPADDPSKGLGIFAPVAGRILYENGGGDMGYDLGYWAVDPSGPSDTTEGPSVADDVASTLVPFPLDPRGFDDVTPIAWSRDGTELLLKRTEEDLFPKEYLFILHADGSETQLISEPMYLADPGATISPDGDRVVFAAQADHLGLWVVDADGGRPTPLPYPSNGLPDSPTFSPDGSQIAYLVYGDDVAGAPHEYHVWIADADGNNAHEILADDATRFSCGNLRWSPAGDLLACTVSGTDRNGDVDAIYTFAPDGSDFTRVIEGGTSPYWSPDGTQLAFTRTASGASAGLAIADADGSNVRAFGFGTSGPWHPGTSVETDEPAPTPSNSFARVNEVLTFTGTSETPGDLVAVDPETGEERVLAEELDDVRNARWSADGRWIALQMKDSLWVFDRTREPRRVFDAPDEWSWSPTGARLAVFRGSETSSAHTLYVIDASTDKETELASILYDVFSPVWSADGTRIMFGVRGGTVFSVDVGTGERSVFVQLPVRLPDEDADSVDGIEWSPDGSRLLIRYDLVVGEQRLIVMNPDGSDIRVLADDALVFGFDWSPDGSRIVWTEDHGGEFHVLVATADGSTSSLVASLPNAPNNPVWSPDGTQIALGYLNAFLSQDAPNLVIPADGSGDAVPLDDLTYESWRGGRFDCDCDLFG